MYIYETLSLSSERNRSHYFVLLKLVARLKLVAPGVRTDISGCLLKNPYIQLDPAVLFFVHDVGYLLPRQVVYWYTNSLTIFLVIPACSLEAWRIYEASCDSSSPENTLWWSWYGRNVPTAIPSMLAFRCFATALLLLWITSISPCHTAVLLLQLRLCSQWQSWLHWLFWSSLTLLRSVGFLFLTMI